MLSPNQRTFFSVHCVIAYVFRREVKTVARVETDDARRFIRALVHLSAEDLRLLGQALRARHTQRADDVAWWQAIVALDRALRRCGRARLAAAAAGAASQAVISSAARHGMSAADDDVRAVARGAAEVARVLVAGEAELPTAECLLLGWEGFLPCRTPPPESHRRAA
jgi:uncharacterized protein YjeT (DUF2065 family)